MTPNVITIKPSIENCDPFKKYLKSTPLKYSLQEIPILYGGGRFWILSCSSPQYLQSLIPELPTDDILVDIFVLNTSLIIWFNAQDVGLEISYLQIPAHAVRKNNEGKLELYIQISPNEDEIIEFSVVPKYWEDDRFYNTQVEKLFTYEFFGLNKGIKLVFNTFNALGKCSCFHTVSADEDDDGLNDDISMDDIYQDGLDNSGNADDMGFLE